MRLSTHAKIILDHVDTLHESDYRAFLHVDQVAEVLGISRHAATLIMSEVLDEYLLDSEHAEDGAFQVKLNASAKMRLDEERENSLNEQFRTALLATLGEAYSNDSTTTFDSHALSESIGASHNRVCLNLEILNHLGLFDIDDRAEDGSLSGVLTPRGYQQYKNPGGRLVFLSHAAIDKPLAAYLKQQIETIYPELTVFASSEDIMLGDDWEDVVLENLEEASLVLVLATHSGVGRLWVWFETGAGWARGLKVIPIRTASSRATGLPQPFTKFQYFDGDSADGVRALFARLADVYRLTKPEIDAPALAARIAEMDAELAVRAISTEAGGRLRDKLKAMADKVPFVRIRPTIPTFAEMDDFQIHELQDDIAVFWKSASGYSVQVPYSRIAEILPATWPERPTIMLNGRLQWITPAQTWRFVGDLPVSGPFGVPKDCDTTDPRAQQIIDRFRETHELDWWGVRYIPEHLSDGWQIVYDEDGCYFRGQHFGDTFILSMKAK